MRHVLRWLLSGAFAIGCSGPTELEQRTLLLEFDRTPTTIDANAISKTGSGVVLVIHAVQGVLIRTDADAASFPRIGGLVTVKDLGPMLDPVVSVFIHTASRPIEADLAYVRQAGGTGVSTHPDKSLILAQMKISEVDGLWGHAGFSEINVYPNTLRMP